MKIRIIFTLFLIFFHLNVSAQKLVLDIAFLTDTTNAPLRNHEWSIYPFDSCLKQIRDYTKIHQLRLTLDSATTDFKRNAIKKPLDLKQQWKLCYYVHYGWEADYKGMREDIYDIYTWKLPEKLLSSKEILDAFYINDSIYTNNPGYEEMRDSVNTYVLLPATYRGNWTPIITLNGNLMISTGNYYPYGNAHSWLRIYFYYFEKVEKE